MANRDEIDDRVCGKLRQFREAKSLSQVQLGKLIGVSGVQILMYEKGNTRISSGTLWTIGKALGVPVEKFYE